MIIATTAIITTLCISLTSLYLSEDVHYIILHHFRCTNGTCDCQILCFMAVLAIGIATDSSICRVFISFQHVAFTKRALIIHELHQKHEVDSTHKGVMLIDFILKTK